MYTTVDNNDRFPFLTLYTVVLISYSPHCSTYISYGFDRENLFDTQELLLKLVITSLIPYI